MAEGGDVQVIHLQDPVGPAPMLLAISPSDGAVTGGGTVTISAAHLIQARDSWSWSTMRR